MRNSDEPRGGVSTDFASERRAFSRRQRAGGVGCVVLFFVVFLLAGLAFLPFLGWPVVQTIGARSWNAVPCTILESAVRSHEGSDSATYSVEVRYRYLVSGRLYESSRYRFLGGSSSGYDGKAEVVAALPVGRQAVCFVDPKNPAQAVLDRGFGFWVLLALVPIAFCALGLWGIISTLKKKRRRGQSAPGGVSGLGPAGALEYPAESPDWLPEPRGVAKVGLAGAGDPGLELRPAAGPVARLVAIVCIALFWNGIVSLFLKDIVAGWRNANGDGCQTLFLVPFVLIGAALLLSVPYQILALFNPRPRLHLDRSRLRPGESARLTWSFSGAAGRIRRLKITIEGREEASYRRGTTTHSDRSTFATLVLLDSDQAASFGSGEIAVTLPPGSMHSFSASHNKILWKLMIAGEIARWPDVSEEFELVVLPEAPRRFT